MSGELIIFLAHIETERKISDFARLSVYSTVWFEKKAHMDEI